MLILAIETSCDDTCASIVNDTKILSNIIKSQSVHKKYGGVVPEIAARHHALNINFVVQKALEDAKISFGEIEYVAVTKTPGLIGSLLVGIVTAETYAMALGRPIVYVNHLLAHVRANFIHNCLVPPFVCLVASGGHCDIILYESHKSIKILARTRDDAPGEAFDKVARMLKLEYPGGPEIENLAKNGNSYAFDFPKTRFKDSLDFSFSGLKTNVMNKIQKMTSEEFKTKRADIAASFQRAVIEILVENLAKSAEKFNVSQCAISGGVASNSSLQFYAKRFLAEYNISFCYPSPVCCTDNAAMIGVSAYYEITKGASRTIDLRLSEK